MNCYIVWGKGSEAMKFNFLERLQETAEKTMQVNKLKLENASISQEEIELAQKLDAVEEYSIDRWEEDVAILENRETGKIIQVDKSKLPENSKEGDILKKVNGKYSLDKKRTEEETNRIKNKMDDLWN